MNTKQRIWLYLVIFYSSLHLVRDVMQDLRMDNWLTRVLASPGPPKVTTVIYWTIFNTYLIEITALTIALYCLKRNKFGKLGKLTVIVAILCLLLWSLYYFIF